MNKQQIADVLRDYHWMINEIARIKKEMNQVESSGVAQYGLEATMPKAQGGTSDPILNECVRREKKSKRQVKLENKVMYIQDRIDRIKGEREKVVLDCLLDGMSIRKISNHMGFSHTHISRIIDDITKVLADVPNVPNGEKMKI